MTKYEVFKKTLPQYLRIISCEDLFNVFQDEDEYVEALKVLFKTKKEVNQAMKSEGFFTSVECAASSHDRVLHMVAKYTLVEGQGAVRYEFYGHATSFHGGLKKPIMHHVANQVETNCAPFNTMAKNSNVNALLYRFFKQRLVFPKKLTETLQNRAGAIATVEHEGLYKEILKKYSREEVAKILEHAMVDHEFSRSELEEMLVRAQVKVVHST